MNSLRPLALLFSLAVLPSAPLVARDVDAAALDSLSREIAQTRVVEVPAVITRAITAVPQTDRAQVATTAVIAA
ncbi:MAG: hypothetical protein J0L84_12435, partial [Verrucomicrobia bacterium]|nr:hypothetical protein [Verrucomicrobiota bacterium]